MAKPVLGNDPFQRGAAAQEPPAVPRKVTKARPPVRKGWKARSSTPAPQIATAATSDLRAETVAPETFAAPSPSIGAEQAGGAFLTAAVDFLYERFWRVTLFGAENLPAGGCLLVANHEGALPIDGPILKLALARQRPELPRARWLAEERFLDLPILGAMLERMGAAAATPENALRLLGEGRPVIVFPEGVQGMNKCFRERYQLKPFGRGGFVKIASRAQVPLVPVAIVGAAEASPVLAKLPIPTLGLRSLPLTVPPLPTKWRIHLGPPLELGQLDLEDAPAVAEWTERIRSTVQRMLDDTVRERGSVFTR